MISATHSSSARLPRHRNPELLLSLLAACTLLVGCGSSPSDRVANILVTSVLAGVSVGATDQFMATAEDRHGKLIAGIVFTWVSSNTNVATVNSNGSAMALLPGTSQITATAEGITSNAVTLTVTPGFLQTGS